MIKIVPSIAVKNGKSTRVPQGDYAKEKVYRESPLDLAKRFEDVGMKHLHVVDLDGARKGTPVNYHILQTISAYTDLKIDFSGGIHTDGDIGKAFEYGATSITAASIAASNKELFASWIISYGREKMILGADVLNNKISIDGWQKGTDIDLFEHIQYFYDRGLKYVKVSDINKDGALKGPALEIYKDVITQFPGICLIASGGVRSMKDIEELEKIGVYATIIGKALYEGMIDLNDLIKIMV